MAINPLWTAGCCISLLAATTIAPAAAGTGQGLPGRESGAPHTVSEISLGLRGVHFIPNHGQWADDDVIYGFKSRGLDIAFRESSLTMHLRRETPATSGKRERPHDSPTAPAASGKRQRPHPEHGLPARPRGREEPGATADPTRGCEDSAPAWEHLTLEVTFPGSNVVLPRAAKPQAARFNYFIGDDASRWASDVPSYGMIVYENIYDGIDLHVMAAACGFASPQILKYEFHCAPGADHTQIRIRYDGIDSMCIDERSGDLLIETSFGALRDTAPIVWQETGGTGVPPVHRPEAGATTLPARFVTLDRGAYAIALDAAPDPTLALVIDPEIEWMLYLGGSGLDSASDLAIDGEGNVLVTGYTNSTDFTGRTNTYSGGPQCAFAVKINPSGTLQWMSYFGGSNTDVGAGIAVDGAGNALVTGWTDSTDFAGRNNALHGELDALVLKVSASGQLQWMTYLGGSDSDEGWAIAVDDAGNALLTGLTTSTDFTGRNNSLHGRQDAFTLKVGPSGQLQWMTYTGGTDIDWGTGIAVDGEGNALLTGQTDSTNFAARNNSYPGGPWSAFALKVGPTGEHQWMTYLGGSNYDLGRGIAIDGAGDALVTGRTASTDFVGRNNTNHGGVDAFALKVSPSGELQWMTYLGGSGEDRGFAIASDADDNALITGRTESLDFVGRNNSYHGDRDGFVLKVTPTGEIRWMAYLGGSNWDVGHGVAVDDAGHALVTGSTRSADFEGRSNSYHGGEFDAFLLRFHMPVGPRLTVAATCPGGGAIRISWEGATPNRQVALIFALNTGSVAIPQPNPCAGTRLGLGSNQIQLVWQGSSGANGSRTINAQAPRAACGGYMQLLDIASCATSNVVRVE